MSISFHSIRSIDVRRRLIRRVAHSTMPMSIARTSFILASAFALSSCAGFNQAIEDQNSSIAGIQAPVSTRALFVSRSADLVFRRGAVETVFEAHIPAGSFRCIAECTTGSFFIAPKGDFTYRHQGTVESRVGGLFVPRGSSRPLVWFWPEATSDGYWQPVADGAWIAKVRPGIIGVAGRPWVERDFVVPPNLAR